MRLEREDRLRHPYIPCAVEREQPREESLDRAQHATRSERPHVVGIGLGRAKPEPRVGPFQAGQEERSGPILRALPAGPRATPAGPT